MHTKIRNLQKTALAIILLLSFQAQSEAPVLDYSKVITNLNNIETPIETAVNKVEKEFRLNGQAPSPGTDNELMISQNSNNPYIASLRYNNFHFRIKLTFKNSSATALTGTVTNEASNTEILDSAVDKLLSNKTIILVPIFASTDQKITAWECITDIGSGNAAFLGAQTSQASDNGKPSIISELSESPYLSNCRYFNNASTF